MLWAWHWEPMCSPDSRRIMEYEVRKHKSKACLRYNNIPSGAEMHLLWKYPSIFINFKRVENFTFWMISNYDIRAYWYFTYHSQENTFIVNVIERKNFPYTFFYSTMMYQILHIHTGLSIIHCSFDGYTCSNMSKIKSYHVVRRFSHR